MLAGRDDGTSPRRFRHNQQQQKYIERRNYNLRDLVDVNMAAD